MDRKAAWRRKHVPIWLPTFCERRIEYRFRKFCEIENRFHAKSRHIIDSGTGLTSVWWGVWAEAFLVSMCTSSNQYSSPMRATTNIVGSQRLYDRVCRRRWAARRPHFNGPHVGIRLKSRCLALYDTLYPRAGSTRSDQWIVWPPRIPSELNRLKQFDRSHLNFSERQEAANQLIKIF